MQILLLQVVWPWTPPATCSLRTRTTAASAKWTTTASLPPWRAAVTTASATGARPPVPAWFSLPVWLWTPPATCSLRTHTTTSSAKWTTTASLPPWRAAVTTASATGARPPVPAWFSLPVWLWTPPATCSLRTHGTTASAKWTPTASLPPWQILAVMVIPVMAARPPVPAWLALPVWLWTPPATCSLRTHTTTSSAKWTTTASLPPWRAAVTTASATAARPPVPAWFSLPVWLWTPPATCSLRTHTTTSSAKWTTTASLPPWRAAVTTASATAARPPVPAWFSLPVWLWTPPATCSLRTHGTTAFAKWTPTASLPPWQAMAVMVIPVMAARPPVPAWLALPVWLWTPPATCSLRTHTTTS